MQAGDPDFELAERFCAALRTQFSAQLKRSGTGYHHMHPELYFPREFLAHSFGACVEVGVRAINTHQGETLRALRWDLVIDQNGKIEVRITCDFWVVQSTLPQ